ncbi:PRC-barrel domain-containing protein [Halomonas sp. CKK8]|uniref:PRC-barrel domain-containing protein n=1 Tax=Halomonas sp. CKK8 TaxID=3036127 RepID=UPI002415262C|nr:PRC-barrel domain-containing protein [Halomonas sp. CKK8]WFM70673.1 PRC-barrel domain-containing protein [Halomonas sp. CKK8]
MKKLKRLILSAAIVPALAFSTTAMAEKHDAMETDGEQHAEQQSTGEQQRVGEVGEQQMSGKPAGAFYADDVIGKTVKHRGTDEDVGEIQDLVIGNDGRIVGVVVETSGFLGLGGQHVGLGWDHIEHTMEEDESVFYTDIDEETLRNSPEYERD